MSLSAPPAPVHRLRPGDVWSLALLGWRGRPLRAALSMAGVALGVATMVGVLGISSSSRAQLVAEIDALGTNLLSVGPGSGFATQSNELPPPSAAMARRIGPVVAASAIGDVAPSVHVYRNDRIPMVDTAAIAVYTAQPSLLSTLQGRLADGRFLDAAMDRLPVVVLGADAASALGVDRAAGTPEVWIGDRWFGVIGILEPLPLAPELDRSVLVGADVARRLLGADGAPSTLYVRSDPSQTAAVASVLAATVDPGAPQDVTVANPADALVARADASAAFEGLFLALGAVALVVGGVGIANVMLIGVLERRTEIGVRRALGARRRQVGLQFAAESLVLAAAGAAAGVLLGVLVTALYASARDWPSTVPPAAPVLAAAGALTVGALAGLYPAVRAARLTPAEALRTV